MEIKHIKTMVKQKKSRRGLKKVPQYHWKKHWISNTNDYCLLRYQSEVPSPLDKQLKIGGIIIQ